MRLQSRRNGGQRFGRSHGMVHDLQSRLTAANGCFRSGRCRSISRAAYMAVNASCRGVEGPSEFSAAYVAVNPVALTG
jgi:hypothetical protein